ncbi:unnamed protein product, partial [Symbiodinium sp. CCMP2592]
YTWPYCKMDENLREGQELAPPSREETKYFTDMFPKPQSPTQMPEQTAPMDTSAQPKRGTFDDSSAKEEGQQKALKATAKLAPKVEPAMTASTAATPTGSQSSQPLPSLPPAPSTADQDTQQKGKNKGKKDKGKGKGKTPKNGNNGPSQTSSNQQANLVSAIGRLCLRHEDAIAIQQANQGYIFFLRTTGPESIIQPLARVSQAWNQAKETEIPRHPLRIVLLSTLLEATIERVEAAVKPDKRDATIQTGLVINQGGELYWPYIQWNQEQRTEEVISTDQVRPLEHARLLRRLNHLRDSITPENILRCHGHHKIAENLETEVYRLVLEVETVGEEAQNIHEWLRLLVNCTAWKLIGGRFRRGRLGRSPLAKRLGELLGQ